MTLPRPDGRTGDDGAITYHVLAGEQLGSAVAQRLRADGHSVALLDGEPDGVDGERGETVDVRMLEAAGVEEASTVVVATRSDSRNLLIAQLVRARFDVSEVVVLANDPARIDVFEAAGHEPVCAVTALSADLVENA